MSLDDKSSQLRRLKIDRTPAPVRGGARLWWGGGGRVERAVGERHAERVGELRAGQQLAGSGVWGDLSGVDGGSPVGGTPIRP